MSPCASDISRSVSAALGDIAELGDDLIGAFQAGRRVLTCGNGGSAADAQHLAAELSGRFIRSRRPLAATALSRWREPGRV